MWEQINTFHSDNHQTLGELLLGFFHYYCRFEYNLHAISVRLGARIPIDECRSAKSSRNDPHQWKLLCIEEPFDLTNTARSVYDIEAFENIKSVFRNSYRKLQETRDLLSIFKQNDLVHIWWKCDRLLTSLLLFVCALWLGQTFSVFLLRFILQKIRAAVFYETLYIS